MSGPKNWTLDELLAAEATGDQLEFVLFWGHTPPASGEIGPHVFSQWWPHRFEFDGISYPTAEHYMMAEKARVFGDQAALNEILTSETPKGAKACGRKVQGFDNAVWQQHREDIVLRASLAKFGSDQTLRDYLVGTGDSVLVEASPPDQIWGIGMAQDNPSAKKPSQWKGLNLLGFALMRARAELA